MGFYVNIEGSPRFFDNNNEYQDYQRQQMAAATAPQYPIDSGSMVTKGGVSSSVGAAYSPGSLPPRISDPGLNPYNYSTEAQSYPTYMRNLGENNAQRAYQTEVNQGGRLGNSSQSYMHAQDNLNNSRLNYMGQAGQAQMGMEGQLAAQNQLNNQNKLNVFGGNITQRGQDIGYMSSFNRGGNSQGINIGGGNNLPRSGTAALNRNGGQGTYTSMQDSLNQSFGGGFGSGFGTGNNSYMGFNGYSPLTGGYNGGSNMSGSDYGGGAFDGMYA